MSFNNAHDLRQRGFSLMTRPLTIATLDPAGDGDDRDALTILSREEHQRGEPYDPDFAVEMVFRLMMYHKLPREWEFPDKLASLIALNRELIGWTRSGRQSGHVFNVESNGVGYSYASSLREKISAPVFSYVTVATTSKEIRPDAKFTMPRLKALDNLRVLIETGYVKMQPDAPGAADIKTELGAFVWRGRNRPEAMQGQHDDGVMSLCGGVWLGSKILPPALKQVKFKAGKTNASRGARMRIN